MTDTATACSDDHVRLVTPAGTLEGSLLCPATPGPWPVVLIIAGSGPTDRNGNSVATSNDSLRLLADALATRGIASLRYDKRGIAASSGAMRLEADLRFDMLADDAAGWAEMLRADARFRTVTIAGHSEGSLLGMLAAQRAHVDAYISIAGVGSRADHVIHSQLAKAVPPELAVEADRIMAQLVAGEPVESVPSALYALFRPSVQPYIASWFKYDPSLAIATLQVPVLIVHGTADIQVGVHEAKLLAAADTDATLVVIEGMNHVLKTVGDDVALQQRSYADPSLPLNGELVDAVCEFVMRVRT